MVDYNSFFPHVKNFSHTINNPNHLPITTNNYVMIPFGHRCSSALACFYANIRKMSLPFDWTAPAFPKRIQNVLANNFNDFIPDVHNNNFMNKYDIMFPHFNSDKNVGIEECKRRIERFNDIIYNNQKKYFVYINEDYLYTDYYRQDTFTNNNFNEMLELEKFLKIKYVNMDFTILYFDFKNHYVPPDSKIINIVVNSPNLYNTELEAPFVDFRIFCGKILSELFHTELTLSNEFIM